jgi:hypothetical protein
MLPTGSTASPSHSCSTRRHHTPTDQEEVGKDEQRTAAGDASAGGRRQRVRTKAGAPLPQLADVGALLRHRSCRGERAAPAEQKGERGTT